MLSLSPAAICTSPSGKPDAFLAPVLSPSVFAPQIVSSSCIQQPIVTRRERRKYKASVKGCQARCILGHWQGNILFSRGACHRAFRVNVSHSSKDLHCKRSVLPVHHYQTVVFSPIRSEAQTDHRLLNHERVHDHAVVVHTDLPSAQRH